MRRMSQELDARIEGKGRKGGGPRKRDSVGAEIPTRQTRLEGGEKEAEEERRGRLGKHLHDVAISQSEEMAGKILSSMISRDGRGLCRGSPEYTGWDDGV